MGDRFAVFPRISYINVLVIYQLLSGAFFRPGPLRGLACSSIACSSSFCFALLLLGGDQSPCAGGPPFNSGPAVFSWLPRAFWVHAFSLRGRHAFSFVTPPPQGRSTRCVCRLARLALFCLELVRTLRAPILPFALFSVPVHTLRVPVPPFTHIIAGTHVACADLPIRPKLLPCAAAHFTKRAA